MVYKFAFLSFPLSGVRRVSPFPVNTSYIFLRHISDVPVMGLLYPIELRKRFDEGLFELPSWQVSG
jgi:hypothetical protein